MYDAQGGMCAWCNMPMTFDEATEDHATPRTRGGSDTADNIELFHRSCNSKKGKKDASDPGNWPTPRWWDIQSVLDEVERRSKHRSLAERQRAEDSVRWGESTGLLVEPGGKNRTGCLNFVLQLEAVRIVIMQLWGSSILQLHFPRLAAVSPQAAGVHLPRLVSRIASDVPAIGRTTGFLDSLRKPSCNAPEVEFALLIPDHAWKAFTSAWTDALNDIRAD